MPAASASEAIVVIVLMDSSNPNIMPVFIVVPSFQWFGSQAIL